MANNNKVLVTGCAGFIGSHLAEKLLADGHEVIGVDCFTKYYGRSVKEKNIETINEHENFDFFEADLVDYNLKELLEDIGVVYHLAAQPGVRYSWEEFKEYSDNNILATQRLLDACKEEMPRFIFASSSSVYGNTPLPAKETCPLNPISPYGLTKKFCEDLCTLYHENFEIPVLMLRYFTVYGPRQRPDMAINIFAGKMLRGEPIQIYGDGKQSRDFTYVEDIVAGTILAGKSNLKSGTFNLGSGESITLNRLLELIGKAAGKTPNLDYTDSAIGDVMHTKASISNAKKKLGYNPEFNIEDGIKKYVAWYKQNLK